MVGVTELIGAVEGLKTAYSLVQALNSTDKTVAINDVKLELGRHLSEAQGAIMAAHAAQAASTERIRQLEEEIGRMKDWEGERQRYQLTDVSGGILAYMPKPGMESGQPAHWLCTNCFENRHKAFLQYKGRNPQNQHEAIYGCDNCKASLPLHWQAKPQYPPELVEIGPEE